MDKRKPAPPQASTAKPKPLFAPDPADEAVRRMIANAKPIPGWVDPRKPVKP